MSRTRTTTLAGALRQAAAELQAQQPPPGLLARVHAARAPAPRVPAARSSRAVWAWSGAAAFATLLLGSAVLMLRLPAPDAVVDDGLRFGSFIAVVPHERWPSGAAQAWLVRTELPSDRLATLGLPYDPARAGERVRAELLMQASGEVLAVRLVP